MKNMYLKGLLGAGLLATQLAAQAADLDLYANPPPNPVTDRPNVLFVIDNTANWNQAFANEKLAIKNALRNIPADKFNIGIMLATETGGGNSNISGGYIRAAIRPMNAANKLTYEALVNSFDVGADKSSGGAAGLQMAEVYHYFAGLATYSGRSKVKADYTGNTAGTTQTDAVHALPGNAMNSFGATTYNSPVPDGSCAKNYVIYISNGPNQSNSSDNTTALNMLKAAAGGGAAGDLAAQQIPIVSGSADSPMDEWTRFMRKSALGITTFTLDVDRVTTGQGPGWTTLLKSAAGEGNYFNVTSGNSGLDIEAALNEALSRIQSVNSVFAAVSLPASANVQGAYLNQLYVGMFRPDEFSNPRWLGNLKQYKMGTENNLVDSDGADAISTQTGFVAECARSFWTPARPTAASPDLYWSADPKGACIPSGNDPALYANADSPDGNIVEKGAAGYRLRGMPLTGAGKRTVYSCATSWTACTALVAFDSAVATSAALGVATTTERDNLIKFARGENVTAELGKATTVMRPSAHGDVIHSNPLALSYGSDVIVFYGSNDGMLHAINGNRTASYAGTYAAGAELWSFIPPEYFPNIDRLYDNEIKVSVSPANGDARTGAPKPYGIDGPISAYREGGNTNIYAAMRRGGRAVYAFDVSTPATPVLKWKSGCATAPATDCTAGATGLGQTWSTARPTKASGHAGGLEPVLIMGGGYDDCEDEDRHTCNNVGVTPSPKGRNILVLDATTGAVLKSLPTDRGVVSDIRIVPDAAGLALYGYAADLGGNIYRITIGALAPSAWTIKKIAALGCATPADCASNRKFMFAPSVIPELDGSVSLYLGSGDREKPLGGAFFPRTVEVANYFFKVKDNPTDLTWLTSENATCGADIICLASLQSAGSTAGTCGAAAPLTGKGWTLALRPTEQVVTLAATRFGVTTFSTHMPDVPQAGVCTGKLGKVHVYNLDIGTAAPMAGSTCSEEVKGGGLPPPPEKMDVCANDACTVVKSICIGCSTQSPIQSRENAAPSSTLGSNAKRRVYWYIQK